MCNIVSEKNYHSGFSDISLAPVTMLVCNANGSGPSRGSNFSLATFLSENVVQHLYVFLLPRTFSTSYPEEIYGMIVICWRRNANRSHNWERSSETIEEYGETSTCCLRAARVGLPPKTRFRCGC